MLINRYVLKEIGFSKDEVQLFLRTVNQAYLKSSCTKSLNVDGIIRMIYHCDSEELITFLQNKVDKMQRGNICKIKQFLEKLNKTTREN